jgi:adenosylmethionine-8-amino-7-oxononanoate aminotransferase
MDPDRTRSYPFVSKGEPARITIARTEGPYLITPEGQRIFDAAGGAIVSSIGHGRAEVAEAAQRALEQTSYVVPPFATESRVRLTERLQENWLPEGVTRVLYTSGGSESVEAAIRVARQHHVAAGRPGRWKIVGRQLGYHGITLTALAVGGHSKRRAGFEPLLMDFPKAPACYSLRCELCREQGACSLACADALERVIEEEGADTIAAFIAEPVGGSTAGALVPPDGYWPRIAEICRRHQILVIADEVMPGFGRTGRCFAVDHWGLVPDFIVGGKGLASGYAPIGGVFAREEVIAPIAARGDEVMFYTYGAQPASCAIADKVLEIVERENLVARAAEMGDLLQARLRDVFGDHPHVAEIRGLGLLQAVEFVRDRDTLDPFPADEKFTHRLIAAGLGHGVFFYPGGVDPARDVVCFGPPFTITPEQIDFVVEVLEKSVADVLGRMGS